ncbi:hypothetical protein COOONC_14248, partial [Cooperia oncophora]
LISDDEDYDVNEEDAPSTWNKVLSWKWKTSSNSQPQHRTTTPLTRKLPRKLAKAMRSRESPSSSMDPRSVFYEEEIKLSMLRQQLALEELKLLVIKNDLARAQLERETIATERERFELERAKHVSVTGYIMTKMSIKFQTLKNPMSDPRNSVTTSSKIRRVRRKVVHKNLPEPFSHNQWVTPVKR